MLKGFVEFISSLIAGVKARPHASLWNSLRTHDKHAGRPSLFTCISTSFSVIEENKLTLMQGMYINSCTSFCSWLSFINV